MKNNSCEGCNSMCCKYIVTEIDVPEELGDFENIKWYVCHKDVYVFVDYDDKWYLEFITPCKYLDEKGWCTIYEKRPEICREYDQETCLFYNNDYEEKFRFGKIEDVEKYILDVFEKDLHIIPEDDEEDEVDEEEDDEDDDEENLNKSFFN